ncbi:MAG: efflux RND transporter periplasmic adaptor subunit [Nitrospirota bacterium]
MKRPIVLIALFFGLLLAGWLLVFQDRGDSAKQGARERVAVVKRGDLALKVIETGSVEPATVVEIKSEQSGEVTRIFATEGQKVKKGQRLAVIQQESVQAQQAAQYRADLERERLALDEAERQLSRHRALHEKGFLSRQEVETGEKNVETAKIRYALARRQLKLVLGGDEQALEQYLARPLESDHLEEFTVSSPVDGSVITVDVEPGEIINSGTSTVTGGTVLMTLADLGRMVVKTHINEVNIARVLPGQPVEIRLDAVPGRVYHGAVASIAPRGVRADNIVTYEVTITISDADAPLKPSMTANIDVLTGTLTNALYLPVEAVDHQAGRDFIWLRRGGELIKQPVTISQRTETDAILLESADQRGLREGDQVVIPSTSASS